MKYQGGAGMELGNRVSGDGGGKSLKFHAKSVFSSNFHSV